MRDTIGISLISYFKRISLIDDSGRWRKFSAPGGASHDLNLRRAAGAGLTVP